MSASVTGMNSGIKIGAGAGIAGAAMWTLGMTNLISGSALALMAGGQAIAWITPELVRRCVRGVIERPATAFVGQASQTVAQPVALETEFQEECMAIDLNSLPQFPAYLSPNETKVLAILSHLAKARPGLIVSAGTERSFFDLALSNPECEGLVVRDIHPYVKAYVDFNTLLLRIAKDRSDYVQLSTPYIEQGEPHPDKIEEIRRATENADMPLNIKQYYLKHLKDFASIYFRVNGGYLRSPNSYSFWREHSEFDGVKYDEDNTLFENLQRHARSGNIIAVVGNMDDLAFLDERNIAILDISNIPDYFILNIKTKSTPTIIATKVKDECTEYASSVYRDELTPTETKELNDLSEIFNKIVASTPNDHPYSSCKFGNKLRDLLETANPHLRTEAPKLSYYSKNLLAALTAHKNQYCIRINWLFDWVDFSPKGNARDWFRASGEKYIANCTKEQFADLKPFIPLLRKRLFDDSPASPVQKQFDALIARKSRQETDPEAGTSGASATTSHANATPVVLRRRGQKRLYKAGEVVRRKRPHPENDAGNVYLKTSSLKRKK